jgi:hypothetical protein
MGGYMQPQGHFQVVTNTVDFLLNPQATLDMPRWQWMKGKTVHVEPEFPNYLVQSLVRKGHDIQVTSDGGSFGRGKSFGETLKQECYKVAPNPERTEQSLLGRTSRGKERVRTSRSRSLSKHRFSFLSNRNAWLWRRSFLHSFGPSGSCEKLWMDD